MSENIYTYVLIHCHIEKTVITAKFEAFGPYISVGRVTRARKLVPFQRDSNPAGETSSSVQPLGQRALWYSSVLCFYLFEDRELVELILFVFDCVKEIWLVLSEILNMNKSKPLVHCPLNGIIEPLMIRILYLARVMIKNRTIAKINLISSGVLTTHLLMYPLATGSIVTLPRLYTWAN